MFTFSKTALVISTAFYVFSGIVTSSYAQASIDADAAKSFAAQIQTYKGDCDEPIRVAVKPASISPGVVARVVNLLGGSCFGVVGQNAYLVAKEPSGWRKLLSVEPGFITVRNSSHAGYADVDTGSTGMCVVSYRWNGNAYVLRARSHDCQ